MFFLQLSVFLSAPISTRCTVTTAEHKHINRSICLLQVTCVGGADWVGVLLNLLSFVDKHKGHEIATLTDLLPSAGGDWSQPTQPLAEHPGS